MDRGVQEHYWTVSGRGRTTEVVYRSYSDGIDGEHFFQFVMALCFMYFVGRLFFNGLVTTLIIGLTVALIIQLLESVSSSVRPAPGCACKFATSEVLLLDQVLGTFTS